MSAHLPPVLAALAVVGVVGCARGEAAPDRVPAARAPVAATEPIAAEADVYRSAIASLAIDPLRPRRRAAHGRTLATFRALRAYPGAPPRVPHGLTSEEMRTQPCGVCHARGGFSPRFEAYAPVTPHPEREDCLQCHATDAMRAGIALPAGGGNAICRQCHAPGAGRMAAGRLARRPMDWPAVPRPSAAHLPPVIPHDLAERGDCVACHAGPGAVAEIRTSHPERTDCRQCHVGVEGDAARGEAPAGGRGAP